MPYMTKFFSASKAHIPQTVFFCRQRSQAWVTRVRSGVRVVEGEEEAVMDIEVDSNGLFFCREGGGVLGGSICPLGL